MKRRAGLVAAVPAASLSLPAGASAAMSFSQGEYTLDTYKLPGSVQSELGGSNSLYEPNTPVAVGDMNGDGRPDILASDYQANQIYVLKAKAARLLASKHSLPAREAIVSHDNRGHALTTSATVTLVLAKKKGRH